MKNFKLMIWGLVLGFVLAEPNTWANPQGGTASRGSVSFNNKGPQLTINASSGAFINWQSFNIGVGETTRFIQPTSSSVVWNQINDPNPSQILGTLNANGYVVLQNQSGFFIGGQATISTHGLVMTTTPIVAPNLWSGGPWSFNTPPPTARIVNYGQVKTDKGGSVFLIAHDIENHGTINAPEGQVGLYAGKHVWLSERPDGRGLSAQVIMPEGSVDNSGTIIADAGTIAMRAQVVNQGGLVQANSIRQVNGRIELVASDALNLGPNSLIQAKGGEDGISQGGSVLIKSDKDFSDQPGSAIDISGGTHGGQGGQLEISAATLQGIQSKIDGHAANGFKGGNLTLDPYDLTIDSAYISTLTPMLQQSGLYGIEVQADDNIEVQAFWTLRDPGQSATLSLTAGNSIIFDDNSGIRAVLLDANGNPTAQNLWNVSLTAGTQVPAGSKPDPNNAQFINGFNRLDGIYLDGNSSIMTMNGNISLWAANELIINPGPNDTSGLATGDVGNGSRWNGIRTARGGSIDVTAVNGNVNTGGNYNGYIFGQTSAPYYKVSPNVGGISTMTGGNVTINAGGNVTSYMPTLDDYSNGSIDAGTGAFGGGDVTVTAGGNISGHYVLQNGIGKILSQNGNVGSLALSLVKGNWSVSAPNGNISVQEVRNPNGELNDAAGSVDSDPGYHRFDYDPNASVSLSAGKTVEITGSGALNLPPSAGSLMPLLFPPTLNVSAGGDFVLDTDVTLFPSPYGGLSIRTGGNFESREDPNSHDVNVYKLIMSDSGAKQWDSIPPDGSFGSFLPGDHAAIPPEINNPYPVQISVAGSINNVDVYTTKETRVTVGGNMYNSGLLGENLHPTDVTSVNVAGTISYPAIYTTPFVTLNQPIVGADPLHPDAWASIFSLIVDPVLTAAFQVPANSTLADIKADANSLHLVLNQGADPNPGFVYDAATKQIGYKFQMTEAVRGALEGPLQIITLDKFGNPVVKNGHFVTTSVSFVPISAIESLYNSSQSSVKDAQHLSPGFQIGGPGRFEVNASKVDLGSSSGIISWGRGNGAIENGGKDYSSLKGVTGSGAALDVKVAGDLTMLTSTIASIDGGNVTVTSGGEIDLSQGQLSFAPVNAGNAAFGIYTSGHSDVRVTADKDINVGSARIGTFNGGDVFVESENGNVNAGNGANSTLVIPVLYQDPNTGDLTAGSIQGPKPFGSGIIAISPASKYQAPSGDGLPGNITVTTPHGDIVSTLGGIQQFALNGDISGGPTITLTAGTPATENSPASPGNVDLGAGGVIGGTVNITAQGNIKGLIVSRQNANINASQSFSGTLLAGGSANVSASGGISGTIAGIGGVNVSGTSDVTASLLGQNVSVGGAAAQSTLGTSAATSSTSEAAAQQASSGVQQQVGNTEAQSDDEKSKKGKRPILTRRVGRVTVILPKT